MMSASLTAPSGIAIVGCGHMGLAYAQSFVRSRLVGPDQLLLVERNAALHAQLAPLGRVLPALSPAVAQAEVLIVAVKPQDAPPVLAELAPLLHPAQTVVSIMAGLSLARLGQALGHSSLVRAMPNMPAQFGMGITAYVASASTPPAALREAERVLATTGKTVHLDDERQLDAVTAVSGSGPAYIYYVAQAMTAAAERLGLEPALAALLVRETLHGAFHVQNATGRPYAELIGAVASRGGTTEAALRVFAERGVADAFAEAIAAAEQRARELGQG